MDALKGALKEVQPNVVKSQLSIYVPADVQQILAIGKMVDPLREGPQRMMKSKEA